MEKLASRPEKVYYETLLGIDRPTEFIIQAWPGEGRAL